MNIANNILSKTSGENLPSSKTHLEVRRGKDFRKVLVENTNLRFTESQPKTHQNASLKPQSNNVQNRPEQNKSDNSKAEVSNSNSENASDINASDKNKVQNHAANEAGTASEGLNYRLDLPSIYIEDTDANNADEESELAQELLGNDREKEATASLEVKEESRLASYHDISDEGSDKFKITEDQKLSSSRAEEKAEIKDAGVAVAAGEVQKEPVIAGNHIPETEFVGLASQSKEQTEQVQPANKAPVLAGQKNDSDATSQKATDDVYNKLEVEKNDIAQEKDVEVAKGLVDQQSGPEISTEVSKAHKAEVQEKPKDTDLKALSKDVTSVKIERNDQEKIVEAVDKKGSELSEKNLSEGNQILDNKLEVKDTSAKSDTNFASALLDRASSSFASSDAKIDKFDLSNQIANQISDNLPKNIAKESNTITVKLSPEHMGEVEVRLVASREGKIESIKLTVKEPETLRLISESQKELLDALKQVTDIEDASLSFNLKEGSEQGRDTEHQRSMHEFMEEQAGKITLDTEKVLTKTTSDVYDQNQGANVILQNQGRSVSIQI